MDPNIQNLIFVPLDLPPLEFDRDTLLEWYDKNKYRGMEEYVAKIGYPWNVVWLRNEDAGIEWRDDIETVFPNFHKHMEALPHFIMRKVYILEQVIDVAAHRDVSREDDPTLGPSTYRSMLINDDPETFYYLRGPNGPDGTVREDASEERIYPRFPQDRMWFVINNYKSRHGARIPVHPNRKLILCVWGNVRRVPHEELLQKSYDRYKEWAISA